MISELLVLLGSMEAGPEAIRTCYSFVLSQARKAALMVLPDAGVCPIFWSFLSFALPVMVSVLRCLIAPLAGP